MDQAKAVINLNEGIIQLEGPVEFVRRYLEKYASAIKGPSTSESKAGTSGSRVEAHGRSRGKQRSCIRAIRAEIKAGFFDKPRSTQAVRERLTEKGVACSVGALRTSLKKAVAEGRLGADGKGRGLVYTRKAEAGEGVPPVE
ncbi:MAG: hypothetical protein HY665_00080 [Chloroflexi bacterium]|nr:hypothetical protein [Chloroflexota bacterium]